MVGFNARRPKPHDYRNAIARNARGNCDFELAPKGVLLCLTVVMGDRLTWYDGEASRNSPWLTALAELRQRATREGHCYQHVQAITVAIDQYAEKLWATAITSSTSLTASASSRQLECREEKNTAGTAIPRRKGRQRSPDRK